MNKAPATAVVDNRYQRTHDNLPVTANLGKPSTPTNTTDAKPPATANVQFFAHSRGATPVDTQADKLHYEPNPVSVPTGTCAHLDQPRTSQR